MIILSILIGVLLISILFVAVCYYGKRCNAKVPENGINESAFIDVNGSKQWVNIYGKDLSNPVMLYVHGGPGMSTSVVDYAVTRKWSDVYTIVTWDQRFSGKTHLHADDSTKLSCDLLISDAMTVIDYACKRLNKEKVTVLGHSWGSLFGACVVLSDPDRFDAFIGTGQLIDLRENEKTTYDALRIKAKDNEEDMKLIDEVSSTTVYDDKFVVNRFKLMNKYGLFVDIKKTDLNVVKVLLFNPHFGLIEVVKGVKYLKALGEGPANRYIPFVSTEETADFFTLRNTDEFPVPYYNINGDQDFLVDYRNAQAYFDRVKAPKKRMYYLKGASHGLLIEDSETFSKYIHEIAKE